MKQNKFGELIFDESDVIDLLMQGRDLSVLNNMIVDNTVRVNSWPDLLVNIPKPQSEQNHDRSVSEWHAHQQQCWHMPDSYKTLDIAAHVLSLCDSQAQLQRCGQELLLYQERDLFDLLRYMKYLVDVMISNKVVWGVGRGSSVSSYVLYKLGVHRIDSMYYNLDPHEFLR